MNVLLSSCQCDVMRAPLRIGPTLTYKWEHPSKLNEVALLSCTQNNDVVVVDDDDDDDDNDGDGDYVQKVVKCKIGGKTKERKKEERVFTAG